MAIVILTGTTGVKFKEAFDAWILAVAPTTVHEMHKSNLRGEWIIRFTL